MMKPLDKISLNNEKIYCRKLGHILSFDYCDSEHSGLPCSNIRNCWFERIPIDDYLLKEYLQNDITHVFAPKEDKLSSLFELIKQAKKQSK